MIEVSYISEDAAPKIRCSAVIDEDATLSEVIYGVYKVCITAGYMPESFDNIIAEAQEYMDDREGFGEYLLDKVN